MLVSPSQSGPETVALTLGGGMEKPQLASNHLGTTAKPLENSLEKQDPKELPS